MARFRAPPAGTVNEDLHERIAELEKFHKAVRNAYYAPPMEAAPATDHDHRMVSRAVCQALAALEEGKQDG